MKRKMVSIIATLGIVLGSVAGIGEATKVKAADVEISTATFGEETSVMACARMADANKDGMLSEEEANTITQLAFTQASNDISAMVKYFPKLTSISVSVGSYDSLVINHSGIKTIQITGQKAVDLIGAASIDSVFYYWQGSGKTADFSKKKGYEKVTDFRISGSALTNVVAPNQKKLTNLAVTQTKMTKFDATKYTKVKLLRLDYNRLKSLNTKGNKDLISLSCYENKLSSLSISSSKKLEDIGVPGNNLKKLDVSKNKKLTSIIASNNKMNKLNTNANKKLERLSLSDNKLTKLSVSKNKNLNTLFISNNKIKSIDLSKNKKLTSLGISNTKLNRLSLAKSAKLQVIAVGNKYKLLKNVKFKPNTYVSVSMKLPSNKSFVIPKIIPALKGYKFESYNENVPISEDGKIKTPRMGKDTYLYVNGTKGKSTVSVSLNSL